MHIISALPPAHDFVREHASTLTQMGASSVTATNSTSVAVTFPTASDAANASALLRDTVRGAKLVVQSTQFTTGEARASVSGIVDLLRGIKQLEVYDMQDGDGAEIIGVSFDTNVVKSLRAIVDETPLPGVRIDIPIEPA